MTKLVLSFNEAATKALGVHTRLRIKTMKRGGKDYFGIRPSYRVSGKNTMIRVLKNEDGSVTAELDSDIATALQLPEIKAAGTSYVFSFIGYCWFILKELDEVSDDEKDPETVALVTLTKSRKSTSAPKKQDDADGAQDAGVAAGTSGTEDADQTGEAAPTGEGDEPEVTGAGDEEPSPTNQHPDENVDEGRESNETMEVAYPVEPAHNESHKHPAHHEPMDHSE